MCTIKKVIWTFRLPVTKDETNIQCMLEIKCGSDLIRTDLFGSNFASFFFTFVNRLANLTVIADKLPKLAFLSFDLEVPSLDGKFG